MNIVRILGILSLIIGILGIIYTNSTGFEFLFGLLTGIGTGWLWSGKFMVMNKNKSV